jgi:Bacterial SH3 domain
MELVGYLYSMLSHFPKLSALYLSTPYPMNGSLKSLQVFIGILIGLLGLGGIAAGVGYYLFITQISTHPPKPVFAEEREGSKTALSPKPSQSAIMKDSTIQKLAPEAYDAKIMWKDGLSLRKEPNSDAEKVGSVAFEAKVAVVKTSDDKVWVLVQPETENIQGWIKATNVDKKGKEDVTPKQRTENNSEEATPKRTRRKVRVAPEPSTDENNPEEAAPKRTRRKVRVAPEPSTDENNPEEAAPKRTRRKVRVAPEPSADENNPEEAAPKRTRRKPKAAPAPAAEPADDNDSSN